MIENNVEFYDMDGTYYKLHPIQKARTFNACPHKAVQKEKFGKEKFNDCPGIVDYKNLGWILTAWDEIQVFNDGPNTMAYVMSRDKSGNESHKPLGNQVCGPMSEEIATGIPDQNCAANPLHLTTPWMVKAKNISLLIMPPHYHSNIVEKLYIYPGVVDYSERFTTLNIIFKPKEKGSFTIKAGEPLVHIIPFKKETYNGFYGPMVEKREARSRGFASVAQWYRKYCMRKSNYTLEEKQ